jgi:spore coat protein U-like protein
LQRKKLTLGLAAGFVLLGTAAAYASTATSNFQVRIVINAQCLAATTTTLDFGTTGILSANVDATSTIQVTCTNTTPYNIGLDAGTGSGATVSNRKMTSAGVTISYAMYSNAGRTTNWGNTVGTDTVAGTGNGAAQSYTVYGRVPVQSTPAPGTYTDTITVTVTY